MTLRRGILPDLICYVKWAIEWLNDAAKGILLKPGEPYELPDFSRKLLAVNQSQRQAPVRLLFDESPKLLQDLEVTHWRPRGHVECNYVPLQCTLLLVPIRVF